MKRRGSAARKHADRLAWLRPRLARFVAVPGLHDDVTIEGGAALTALCDRLREAGLFGKRTRDQERDTVRRLLSELRGEQVEVGW